MRQTELHVHLDGSLREGTFLELAKKADLPPEQTDQALRSFGSNFGSLEECLRVFSTTTAVLQTPEALGRVIHELAIDTMKEDTDILEVRFCPDLHCTQMSAEAALLAVLDECPPDVQVIVCILRDLDTDHSIRMANLAKHYLGKGVVGLDLAGGEIGNPPSKHAEALNIARDAGVGITIHAGEACGPESIREALEQGAQRIGHACRLGEDPELLMEVIDEQIPLEVCLTSNLQTGSSPSYVSHPARSYFEQGACVTLSTDNRLISRTTLKKELERAQFFWELSDAEVDKLKENSYQARFKA